jgi:UDP-2,4-diacetamido-2,4,6-trideoxy-beta-L-altropyranose hydrolase
MSRIVFRVDASSQLGGGHVVRCATLAQALVQRGAEVSFLCRPLPGHFCDWLEEAGFPVYRMQATAASLADDLAETRAALSPLGPVDWLVVDHYGLDALWEGALRPIVEQVMVIDDKADRPHYCDILLDQNYIRDAATRYDGLVPASCRKLLGPRYALLREEFRVARQSLRVRDGKVRRLLICFGATDPAGHTLATLQAVSRNADAYERIDVVTSSQNPRAAELREQCAALANVCFHCPVEDFATLLEAADLALGAGGTMNWERACLALPTIAFGIADNQEPILASLIQDGVVLGQALMPVPDPNSMAAWLAVAAGNPNLLQGLSARSAALVDGEGADRVVDVLVPTKLSFRPVTLADSKNLFAWRNSPEASGASVSGGVPDYAAHEAWLKVTLADDSRILLLIEARQQPVGIVRFDCTGDEATISIYRVPSSGAACGLVRQATEWLRRNRPDVRRIVANVLPGNSASLAAFRAAGYRDSLYRLCIDLQVEA